MNTAEAGLKEAQEEQKKMFDRLIEVQSKIRRKEREVEFARQRAEEQFWCLERELEESGEPNLLAQVREATDLERELYGIPAGPAGSAAEVPPGPS